MNKCLNCDSEMIKVGVHKEAPQYTKLECPKCKIIKEIVIARLNQVPNNFGVSIG